MEIQTVLIALPIGLAVGPVVNIIAGGNRQIAYGLLEALSTGVGIAFGELLTFGSTTTPFIYEFDSGLVPIYLIGLYAGYNIPGNSTSFLRDQSQIISEDSWQRLVVFRAALPFTSLAVGIIIDLIPVPN